ncbi:MAG: hypothetical protein KA313_00425 [Pseudarcicella sp.]|nr:hypothetical protein [Pseudarcicella sp.]MBP6409544.1 hypothetical protein [Pseudarcicella sp.]
MKFAKLGLILLTVTIFSINVVYAQFDYGNLTGKRDHKERKSNFPGRSSFGLGLGTSTYYGDLNPISRPFQGLASSNIRWNVSAHYQRYFKPKVSFRVGLTFARLFADDVLFEGVSGFEENFIRNLHFRNDVKELSLVGVYEFVPLPKNNQKRAAFRPYIFGGLAVFSHSPKAKGVDSVGTQSKWIDLQPLATEGQGQPGYAPKVYSSINLAIPVGIGAKIKINNEFDFGIELGMRYTFSDYLDDVSGNYADISSLLSTNQSGLSVAMANRSNEKYAAYSGKDRSLAVEDYLIKKGLPTASPTDLQNAQSYELGYPFGIQGISDSASSRGKTKGNDMYLLTTFSLIYHLPAKIKCP